MWHVLAVVAGGGLKCWTGWSLEPNISSYWKIVPTHCLVTSDISFTSSVGRSCIVLFLVAFNNGFPVSRLHISCVVLTISCAREEATHSTVCSFTIPYVLIICLRAIAHLHI